jgi:hypothetical protein
MVLAHKDSCHCSDKLLVWEGLVAVTVDTNHYYMDVSLVAFRDEVLQL